LHPAEHIVAEPAVNASTHGRVPGRDFRVTLYAVGGTLRIEVTDTRGDRLPRTLVDALADGWGVAPGPRPRKTVWAEIDLSPHPGNPYIGGRTSRKASSAVPT
jgi:hypothetical protein